MAINYVIKFKRQHSSVWAARNPTLALAEPGFESDTGRLKVGNGISKWNELPYINPETLDGDSIQDNSVDGSKLNVSTIRSISDINIAANAAINVSKLSGVVSRTNGTVSTASTSQSVVRNIRVSTQPPSGGNDGDVWLVYVP
jgi:hypothetical protein